MNRPSVLSNYKGVFNDLQALTLMGPPGEDPVLDPLALAVMRFEPSTFWSNAWQIRPQNNCVLQFEILWLNNLFSLFLTLFLTTINIFRVIS